MAILLKGKIVADAIFEDIKERIGRLEEKNTFPCLEIIRLGNDAGSMAYERSVEKRFEKLGLRIKKSVLPENAPQPELEALIEKAGNDHEIHGLLLLRPLPGHIDERKILSMINPEKDMDCISMAALAGVFCGTEVCFAPCTAESCIKILDHYNIPLAGKRVAVIGRSLVVGRPLALMLQQRDATVCMCHSKSENMAEICREQDIIVSAAGKMKLVDKSFVKEGQIVIDVGINTGDDGKIHGDVDFDAVEGTVSAISPVPGGVGSVTTTVLASHLVTAAERRL